ncbi:22742_t:CDS:2, partial [Gigaspora margarita]
MQFCPTTIGAFINYNKWRTFQFNMSKYQELCEIHNYPKQPLITYKKNKTKNKKKEQLLPYVKAIDKGKVIQKGYQALAAISYDLPREYLVSQTRSNINLTMNKQIHISLIDINQYLNSEINIDNIENEN